MAGAKTASNKEQQELRIVKNDKDFLKDSLKSANELGNKQIWISVDRLRKIIVGVDKFADDANIPTLFEMANQDTTGECRWAPKTELQYLYDKIK